MMPIDDAVSRVVHEVVQRGLEVPGVRAEMSVDGSGWDRVAWVSRISGPDFSIELSGARRDRFARRYARLVVSVRRVVIPGLRLDLSIGDDVATARVSRRVESDLKSDSYPICSVTGMAGMVGSAPGVPDPLDEFVRYLDDVVLPAVASASVPVRPRDFLADPVNEPIGDLGVDLYCLVDGARADAIQEFRSSSSPVISPRDRYGAEPGLRLLPLTCRDDGTFPRVAYEAFVWCGVLPVTRDRSGLPRFPSRLGCASSYESHLVSVRLVRGNEVYVADDSAYDRARFAAVASLPAFATRFTGDQVDEIRRAVARTLVPLSSYRGGYARPTFLVRRELDLDEVDLLSDA